MIHITEARHNHQAGAMATEGADNNHDDPLTNSRPCFDCADLNAGFYLTGLRVFPLSDDGDTVKYPELHRPLGYLLHRQDCPLCRLVCHAIADKLGKINRTGRGDHGNHDEDEDEDTDDPGEIEDAEWAIRTRYEVAWPPPRDRDEYSGSIDFTCLDSRLHTLKKHTEEVVKLSYIQAASLWTSRTPGTKVIRRRDENRVDKLLLKVRVTLNDIKTTTWIHSMALESPTFSDVPLRRLDEKSMYRGWREQEDELHVLLDDLNARKLLAGRVVQSNIDLRRVSQWLQLCNKHGKYCRPEPLPETEKSIWMIEIVNRRLVSVSGLESDQRAPKFAALSYVWGGPEVPQLKYSSVNGIAERLKSSGGLDDQKWNDIPHTISDAMFLCQQLGIPYLWVDAVCLDQDFAHPRADAEMPNPLDEIMGLLYKSAYLTIVCAAGSDSWSGLPGVRPERARKLTCPEPEWVQGQWLGLYPGSSYQVIEGAKWNSRAWTYQEHLLSKRILAFTDTEVLYECDSLVGLREAIITEHPSHPLRDYTLPLAESAFNVRLDDWMEMWEDQWVPEEESTADQNGADSSSDASKLDRRMGGEIDHSASDANSDDEISLPERRRRSVHSDDSYYSYYDEEEEGKSDSDSDAVSQLRHSANGRKGPDDLMSESGSMDVELASLRGALKPRSTYNLDLFTRVIEEYIGRHMTDPSDALRAIDGVLRQVSKRTNIEFSDKGFPSELFYECLFFDVPHFRPELRRAGFPSWSWSGWKVDATHPDRGGGLAFSGLKTGHRNMLGGHHGQDDDYDDEHDEFPDTPIKFWGNGRRKWLKTVVPMFRPVMESGGETNTPSDIDTKSSSERGPDDDQLRRTDSGSGNPSQRKDDSTSPVTFDEILVPDSTEPVFGRQCHDFSLEERSDLSNTLVCTTDVLEVHIAREGEAIHDSYDQLDERQYRILSPDLGFSTTNLDREWRENQGDKIPMMKIGVSKTLFVGGKEYDPWAAFADREGEPGYHSLEKHYKKKVIVLLLEDSGHELFQRAGMYEIEKEYWDEAPTKRTVVRLH